MLQLTQRSKADGYVPDRDRILGSDLRMLTSGFVVFLSETLIPTIHVLLAEGYSALLLQWSAHHIFPINIVAGPQDTKCRDTFKTEGNKEFLDL